MSTDFIIVLAIAFVAAIILVVSLTPKEEYETEEVDG